MLTVYRLIWWFLLPLALMRLWIKGIKLPSYRHHWNERLGNSKAPESSLWVHAVSVGEVLSIFPFIHEWQTRYSDATIVLTCTTPTARALAEKTYANDPSVTIQYLPYDWSWGLKRFLNTVKPSRLFIIETEIWPNLLALCHQHGVRVDFINGRISDHTVKRYQSLKWCLTPVFAGVMKVAAQSDEDQKRFISIGFKPHQVKSLGNIKYDVKPNESLLARGKEWRAMQSHSFVWGAMSTHPGEEALLIEAHKTLLKSIPDALLCIVPRHPDRFETVVDTTKAIDSMNTVVKQDFSNDALPSLSPTTHLMVGNTLGEMPLYLGLVDVAVIAGSFMPIGGHNILEPAYAKTPAITGPHTFNFKSIMDEFIQGQGVIQVQSPSELVDTLLDLRDKQKQNELIENANQCLVVHQGCLNRILNWVTEQPSA